MEKIIQFKSLTQARYLLKEGGSKDSRVFILAHGFMSNPQKMMKRFEHRLPEGSIILAPCAPFPVPVKEEKAWRVGYSWFFYDNVKEYYFIDYDICQDYMKNLVEALGYKDNPKTIIGFSQGGYSSVHMAEVLENVTHVVGIGCRFKIKKPKFSESLIIEALHGEVDDVVEIAGAKESFSQIPEKNRGRFQSFAKVTHRPSEELLDTAALWCRDHLKSRGESF